MEKRPLMNELSQGRELANQLKGYLDKTEATCESLVEKIISSYEKALSMLDESYMYSYSLSPHPTHHCSSKKRKTITEMKWSEQVKVCSVVEAGPLSDGYSWRKYGQKDILGANHPRAYYRCTHRNVQGCLATKQVQRSDEDSTVFEVSYRGRHTCIQATQLSKALEKNKQQEEKKCMMTRALSFKASAYKGGDEGLFSFASTPIETHKLEEDLFFYAAVSQVDSEMGKPWDIDLDLDFSLDFDVTTL